VASKDGSKSDPKAAGTTGAARRRARTAAEQRQDPVVTSNDPEELAEQIEKTREELAETLDAIADKVSPKRVASRTTKKVGDAVKDGAGTAATTVKAGAHQLKDAVHDKKESLSGHDHDATTDLGEALESVGQDPSPGVGGGFGGLLRDPVAPPPGLHPVPATPDAGGLKLGPPALAGAVAALVVALFVLRRRRRKHSHWR
jgi:hypothetical protein